MDQLMVTHIGQTNGRNCLNANNITSDVAQSTACVKTSSIWVLVLEWRAITTCYEQVNGHQEKSSGQHFQMYFVE
ncbi:hypothetical protein RvY_16465 [Ramazzottius varieornatus]|uniref:Uncharacterized protein n=1 Tax=Ramazzottius varieornatus TaxID=947166 RepID=A0A1D1W2W8_RAMVA|nr:hypothetical protein RvY_16465 [Ramazzottius varieornatus]